MAMTVAGRVIEGQLACPPVSTEIDEDTEERRDRFFTMELYLLDNGTWLVHRTGWSMVYHRAITACTTAKGRMHGEPASVDDLPDEAVPCPVCRPPGPRHLPEGPGTVRYEYPRHSWDQCPTPELVKQRLTTVRGRDGGVSEFMSEPVAELLRNAAAIYPEFAPLLAA
jgi:hypothetical protein